METTAISEAAKKPFIIIKIRMKIISSSIIIYGIISAVIFVSIEHNGV
jgi:hypothetical protein